MATLSSSKLEPPSSHTVYILNPFHYAVDHDRIVSAVRTCLELEDAEPSDVRVLLSDDAEIRHLNHRFRGVDEETDVLTFPDGVAASGDLAIAVPYAERQAQARGIDLIDEIVFLAIHGALHLVGLDDQTEVDRAEMIRRMNRTATRLGMPADESWGSLLHQGEAATPPEAKTQAETGEGKTQ